MTPARSTPAPAPRLRSRRRLVVAIVVVVAAVAAGLFAWQRSGDTDPVAAVVGGVEIRASVVDADLAEESAVPAADKSLPSSNPLRDPDPKVKGSYTAAARAEALSSRILFVLYGQRLQALHLAPTKADRASVRTALCSDPKTGAAPKGTACPGLARYGVAYRAYLLDTQARVTALGRVIYGDAYAVVKARYPDVLRRACFRSVVVADSTVADAMRDALDSGASLDQAAAVGAEKGAVGTIVPSCRFTVDLPSQLDDPRAGAAATISSGSTIYVVQVASIGTGTRADFIAEPPIADNHANTAVQQATSRVVGGTRITITPAYGRWDAQALAVVAPGTKATTTTAPPTTGAPTTSSASPGSTTTTTP